MGSHIVRIKTVGDLRKALLPFSDLCPVTTVDIKYLYEDEGRVYVSASEQGELAATDSQHRQHAILALMSALSCHPVSLELTEAIAASFEEELKQRASA